MSGSPTDQDTDTSRRRFLGTVAGGVAALTVAPGVLLVRTAEAKPNAQPVSNAVRWGLLVDTDKCAKGCDACVSACDKEHGLYKTGPAEDQAQWIRKVEVKNPKTGYEFSLPVMCQHCEKPPCVDVCPTGASFRRADGIVLVDRHICIGCRYCMMACPYKARSFVAENLHHQVADSPRGKGTVGGCNMCVHRVDENENPACVDACDADGHKALIFGDLKDPNSEISKQLAKYKTTQIREDLDLDPGVYYRGI